MLLAGNRYRAQIQADIRPFEGILLGVFFMTAGAELDPAVVLREWPTLATGIAAFIATKAAILFAAGPALGLTRGESAKVALTLAGGGEFALVVFKLAADLGVLPDELAKLLVASVILSMALTPLLGEAADAAATYLDRGGLAWLPGGFGGGGFGRGAGGAGGAAAALGGLFAQADADGNGVIDIDELRAFLLARGVPYVAIAAIFAAFDADGDGSITEAEWADGLEAGVLDAALGAAPAALAASVAGRGADAAAAVTFARDAVVICPFGEPGRAAWRALHEATGARGDSPSRIVAFDLNPERVAAAALAGEPVVYGDGCSAELLRAAGVDRPRAVIVTYRAEARCLEATRRLRDALPPGTPLYVREPRAGVAPALRAAGATDVLSETAELALRFASVLGDLAADDAPAVRARLAADGGGGALEAGAAGVGGADALGMVPGYSEAALADLAAEVGFSQRRIVELHAIFASVAVSEGDGQPLVAFADLSGALARVAADGELLTDAALAKRMRDADVDERSALSFAEFLRVACQPSELAE